MSRDAMLRQWWESRREKYQLFISQYVLDEAAGGDETAAARRIEVIRDSDVLEVDEEVIRLTAAILSTGLIPAKAQTDAAHMAVAARHGIDFLITWNCVHIANAEILAKINFVVAAAGYDLPTVCTPDELFGGEENED
jgi:hypothetical protein